jgi:DNA-binding transcriptional MerR regulator
VNSTEATARPADSSDPAAAEAQGLLFDGDFSPLPSDLGFRGPVACSAAGITYRQLDYWARTGLVVPEVRSATGSGSQRLYSFRDILMLKVIKRLIDAGISLQQIRTAIEHLRARGVQDLTQVTLMSDGVCLRVHLRRRGDRPAAWRPGGLRDRSRRRLARHRRDTF